MSRSRSGPPPVAWVDVDGTLLAGRRSSEAGFMLHLLRRGCLGPRQGAAALGFLLRHLPAYGRHVGKKDKAYLTGLEVERVQALAAAYAERELAPRLRPALLARLALHRAAGTAVLLLTGTPDFLAEPLARRVGAEGCIATRCAARDGRFLARPPLRHPFGEEKLRLAEAWCRARGLDLARCAAYGDSRYDLPLLEAVGEPVAVAPDPVLAREARRRGWTVLDGAPAGGHLSGPARP